MRVAVPEFQGRVSPTFDFCHRVTLWSVDSRGIRPAGHRRCRGLPAGQRAPRLAAMGVEVLLCGAIGSELVREVSRLGIRVVAGLSGEVAEVVAAFRLEALHLEEIRRPDGCGEDVKGRNVQGGGP